MGPLELERHNANLVGGDINGGEATLMQLFFRPANENFRIRRRVRDWLHCWSEKQLHERCLTTIDIATDQICVVSFKFQRTHDVPSDDAFAKSRGEAVDLIFQWIGHIECAAIWDMAICPRHVFAGRCSRAIKERWLNQQDVWTLGWSA